MRSLCPQERGRRHRQPLEPGTLTGIPPRQWGPGMASSLVGKVRGRLAQRKSSRLTTGRSLVRAQYRPPGTTHEPSPPACGNAGIEGSGTTQAPPVGFKMPTKIPQPARGRAASPASRTKTGRPGNGRVVANGAGRAAIRGDSEVIELEHGITVYPAREEKGRWRAVWYEDGQRPAVRGVQRGEAGREAGKRSPSDWRPVLALSSGDVLALSGGGGPAGEQLQRVLWRSAWFGGVAPPRWSPACSGVIFARRVTRNSRISALLSTTATLRRAAAGRGVEIRPPLTAPHPRGTGRP